MQHISCKKTCKSNDLIKYNNIKTCWSQSEWSHFQSVVMSTNLFDTYLLFWDTETTSNRPTRDDIISIGAVLVDYTNAHEPKFITKFHTYVNTTMDIDPVAYRVHGISRTMLKGAPTFKNALTMFSAWVAKYVPKSGRVYFVAHNGSRFDDIMLYCNSLRYSVDFVSNMKACHCKGFIDSLKYIKLILKAPASNNVDILPTNVATGKQSFSLGNCHLKFCNSVIADAHDALADSMALYHVFVSDTLKPLITLRTLDQNAIPLEKALVKLQQSAGLRLRGTKHLRKRKRMVINKPTGVKKQKFVSASRNQNLCEKCMTWSSGSTSSHICRR